MEQARRLAAAEGLDDVVTHRAGNALTDDLGTAGTSSSCPTCYTITEYAGWLSDAGFIDVQIQRLPLTGAIAVVSGRTPEG